MWLKEEASWLRTQPNKHLNKGRIDRKRGKATDEQPSPHRDSRTSQLSLQEAKKRKLGGAPDDERNRKNEA